MHSSFLVLHRRHLCKKPKVCFRPGGGDLLRAKGVPGQSLESWSSGSQSRAGQARSLHFSLSVPLSACGDLDTFWEASRRLWDMLALAAAGFLSGLPGEQRGGHDGQRPGDPGPERKSSALCPIHVTSFISFISEMISLLDLRPVSSPGASAREVRVALAGACSHWGQRHTLGAQPRRAAFAGPGLPAHVEGGGGCGGAARAGRQPRAGDT